MKISVKERLELLEIERRGGSVNWENLEKNFNFTVSPIITAGVDVSDIVVMSAKLAAACSDMTFPLSGIVFFPIILVEGEFRRDDFRSYKRASNGYYVGKNISARDWVGASSRVRRALFGKNLDESIAWIPDSRLPAHEKARLRAIVLENLK